MLCFKSSFMSRLATILCLIFGLLAAGKCNAAVVFFGLGYLPGGATESWARGTSGDGSVVVGWSINGAGKYEAFRWTESTGMIGLGHLPGDENSNAYAVSEAGDVVVGASGRHAFRWIEGGGMTMLPEMGMPPTARYHANAVSPDGGAAAGYVATQPGVNSEAAAWLSGITTLGDLSGGDFYSDAFGISSHDDVVGRGTGADGSQAFLWSGGVMSGLGYLPGGSSNSAATAITPDGSVVVGYSNSSAGIQAFRWTQAGGMVGLGDLPSGFFESQATAVSADGSVIVVHSNTALGVETFVWDSARGMRNLREILVAGGVDLTTWQNLGAWGISADGKTIVGIGNRGGGAREAWVARLGADAAAVPEPASVAVWGLALGTVLTARRRTIRRQRRQAASTTGKC